jgi:limonene 1,2-monooxygenase
MRFGAFHIPIRDIVEDPQLALRRDLELIDLFDHLSYDEFWVGEHHSGGWANILAPELVIAAAAERTRHIKLATGVTSLPYHNPYMVASRAIQLDHLTRGRFILGVGAGSLPVDAYMLDMKQTDTRPRTTEALKVMMHLLTSDDPITYKADWFSLREAQLQMGPFSRPGLEIGISSAQTPASMKLAGQYGLGVMSFGAPRPGWPPPPLSQNWLVAEAEAKKFGKQIDRKNWRLAFTVYVAETREEAFADVRAGFDHWLHAYWGAIGLDINVPGVPRNRLLEHWVETDGALVGSVDDVAAAIERHQVATGGFGTLLHMTHDWASWEKTKRSYELFARYVAPRFTGALRRSKLSQDMVQRVTPTLLEETFAGVRAAEQEVAASQEPVGAKS